MGASEFDPPLSPRVQQRSAAFPIPRGQQGSAFSPMSSAQQPTSPDSVSSCLSAHEGQAERAASLYKQAKDEGRAPSLRESNLKEAIRLWNGIASLDVPCTIHKNLGSAHNLLSTLCVVSRGEVEYHLDPATRQYHVQEAIGAFTKSLASGAEAGRHNEWKDDMIARVLEAFMALVAMSRSSSLHDKLLLRQGALRLPAEIQAEAMIEVVSCIYRHGLRALDADQLLEASKAFAEIERPLTEAEQLSRRAGCTLATEVRLGELRSSVAQHAYLAQARLAVQRGDGFIQRALDSEELDMELVWSGLDAYQDACVIARGHAVDIETEAIGVARRGKIYAKVLRSESLSRPLLVQASTLAASLLPRSFHGVQWYDECLRQLQAYQNASAEADARADERRRAEHLKSQEPTRQKLRDELKALENFAVNGNAYALLEHVYAMYEPRCELYLKNKAAILRKVKDADADTLKKVLRDSLTHYHPDKNSGHGAEWDVRCEEVYKHLSGKYDRVKQG